MFRYIFMSALIVHHKSNSCTIVMKSTSLDRYNRWLSGVRVSKIRAKNYGGQALYLKILFFDLFPSGNLHIYLPDGRYIDLPFSKTQQADSKCTQECTHTTLRALSTKPDFHITIFPISRYPCITLCETCTPSSQQLYLSNDVFFITIVQELDLW